MIIITTLFLIFLNSIEAGIAFGAISACFLVIILPEVSTDGCSLATGIIFSSLIGAISGWIIEVINGRKDYASIVICGILGAIIGGIFYNNGFIVSLPIVPAFASIEYAIGIPLKEKAEQRAEIKRREELERETHGSLIFKEFFVNFVINLV